MQLQEKRAQLEWGLLSEPAASSLVHQFMEHLAIEPTAPAFSLPQIFAPELKRERIRAFKLGLEVTAMALRENGLHEQAEQVLKLPLPAEIKN